LDQTQHQVEGMDNFIFAYCFILIAEPCPVSGVIDDNILSNEKNTYL